jgi:DNA repair exonuclease SbcCD ATPase subunit
MPRLTTQPCCYKYECQVTYATAHALKSQEKRKKQERKELREAKQRIKSRAEWLKEAQSAVNKYIRLRDADQPCISCSRFHSGQYHAGHYRTVGSCPELRFEEYNIHKQCSACNNHLSGNIINYRINLIRKIGLEKVEWLEGKHEPKHYTIDDLKAIKAKYKTLCRELEQALTKGE